MFEATDCEYYNPDCWGFQL